ERPLLEQDEAEERDRQARGRGKEHAAEAFRRGGVERGGRSAGIPVSTMAPNAAINIVLYRLREKFIVPTAMPNWRVATAFCSRIEQIGGTGPNPMPISASRISNCSTLSRSAVVASVKTDAVASLSPHSGVKLEWGGRP